MLDQALLTDSAGRPMVQAGQSSSQDWDEVQDFCRRVYMPYQVRPLGRLLRPDATMRSAKVGRITFTRFSYGVPIHLSDFDPGAGNILVLNTLRGALRHHCETGSPADTGPGESFVVDCSRAEYWLDGDADHMQLNLTIPHDVMAETAHRWFGFVPDDRLWTKRLAFGGRDSRWRALLSYVVQSIRADGSLEGDHGTGGAMGRRLEELICVDLLQIWAAGAGVSLKDGARAAAPRYVRDAEALMERRAQDPPTIGEVAAAVGVSARTLSAGFQRFRGVSPSAFLGERRLEGLRQALGRARPGDTVTSIASDWGYLNFGALAQTYRRRYGEPPSQTLHRALGGTPLPISDSPRRSRIAEPARFVAACSPSINSGRTT